MSNVAKAPVNNKRPYMMRKGIASVNDLVDGQALANVAIAGAKTIYYVDGNYGSDSQGGTGGWDNAMKTLSTALAASQADISSGAEGWAARNVILCKGDALDEDLVLLAQKTDVIGCGSYNANAKCALIGNHVPTGATNSGYGTRFFNMYFTGNAAGGDIWTLDSTVANLEFHNCEFRADTTTACTAAIVNTASGFMGLYGNEFNGLYTDATIEFATGGGFRGCRIVGNYIEGANNGIELHSGTTPSAGATLLDGFIQDNVINVAVLTIDDNADIAYVMNNYLFSAVNVEAEAVDLNKARAGGNYLITGELNILYPAEDSTTT